MELSDCNYVILRTNRARCALNKKILNLLNEESVSGESRKEGVIHSETFQAGREIFQDTCALKSLKLSFRSFGQFLT